MNHALTHHILAQAVMSLHFAVVIFVIGGLAFIVVGSLAGLRPARSLWFRITHLATVALVAVQAWFGAVCPLTTLEMRLRAGAGEATYSGGFIEHWLRRLLYYDAPLWVFTAAYTVFGAVVLAAWWYFPPKTKPRARPDVSIEPRTETSGRS